jgi:ubiquinone/menaquinone biosynthesis C-methylase UbiE
MKILDIGCGTTKFQGAIGVDCIELPGVDIVANLNIFPWPFEDNSIDRIIFKHSISHFNDIVQIMEEVHRICKPGAVVDILAPHYSSDNYLTDPTHKMSLGYRSMNYFCTNIPNWKYQYSKAKFKLVTSHIGFAEYDIDFNVLESRKRISILKLFGFEYFVNKMPRLYEKFFAFIVPAHIVYYRIMALKK